MSVVKVGEHFGFARREREKASFIRRIRYLKVNRAELKGKHFLFL